MGKGDSDKDLMAHGGADTSEKAHRSTSDNTRKNQKRRIFAFIQGRGGYGATADEVEIMLELPHQTASARITELSRDAEIHHTKLRRKTKRGKSARVHFPGPPPALPTNGETGILKTPLLGTVEALMPDDLAKVRKEAKTGCPPCNMILRALGPGAQLRDYPVGTEDPALPVAGQKNHISKLR